MQLVLQAASPFKPDCASNSRNPKCHKGFVSVQRGGSGCKDDKNNWQVLDVGKAIEGSIMITVMKALVLLLWETKEGRDKKR